jgi:hypothetical protein
MDFSPHPLVVRADRAASLSLDAPRHGWLACDRGVVSLTVPGWRLVTDAPVWGLRSLLSYQKARLEALKLDDVLAVEELELRIFSLQSFLQDKLEAPDYPLALRRRATEMERSYPVSRISTYVATLDDEQIDDNQKRPGTWLFVHRPGRPSFYFAWTIERIAKMQSPSIQTFSARNNCIEHRACDFVPGLRYAPSLEEVMQ